MALALFPVIVSVTFVPFPQIFPPNDLTLFVHLMLVYRLVEIKKKLHISLFFIFICILSWMISLEARGRWGERKKKIVFQTTEQGIHKTSGGDGEWYRVDAALRVSSVKRRQKGDWVSESGFGGCVYVWTVMSNSLWPHGL